MTTALMLKKLEHLGISSLTILGLNYYFKGYLLKQMYAHSLKFQSAPKSGLMTLAATVSIIRVIYWFLLHDKIGPVVINMSRAILDILVIYRLGYARLGQARLGEVR
jgi:hypothetical protein